MGRKLAVEECLALDVNALTGKGVFRMSLGTICVWGALACYLVQTFKKGLKGHCSTT